MIYALLGGIIKQYNHDKRRWLVQFDNGDEDQYMRYDAVLKFADEGAETFHDYTTSESNHSG